jgi:AraC-like DNA-binding protein/tetratricopeptide (TPR) repeat protein
MSVICYPVFAAHTQTEDSLLNLLQNANGVSKLTILHQLQQNFLYSSKDWQYNDRLLEEAKKQENTKYQAIALTNRVAYYLLVSDKDSIFYYGKIAEEFDAEHGITKDLFLVKQLIVIRYFGTGYFSLGFKKAREMNNEAIKTGDPQAVVSSLVALGNAYLELSQFDEAIRCFKEARTIPPTKETPYKPMEIYLGMASSYINSGNKEMAFLYLDSIRDEAPKIKKAYPTYNLLDYEISGLLGYIYYHIEDNRLDEAWKKIQQIEKIMHEGEEIPFYVYLLNKMKMRYFLAQKDYDNTWRYYHLAYDYCKANHLAFEMRNLLKNSAEMLSNLGLFKEAAKTYQELQIHTDSVNVGRYFYESNQIWTDYEVNKRENEIDQQKEELKLRRHFNIILVIFSFLLLLTAYIIGENLSAIKAKNFLLFNQIKELTKVKTELMKFRDVMQEKVGTLSDNETPENLLFDKTENFMGNKKPYMNSDYGRKNLITDMNTNEVYLAKAIRSATRMTIQEYINKWRIEHAKYLLLQDMNQTIEAVSMDSGFTSSRNFYRLFKETFGMSPTEFRNYVKENYKTS